MKIIKQIPGSHNLVFIIEQHGNYFLQKTYIPHNQTLRSKIWRLFDYYKQYPFRCHVVEPKSIKESIQKELLSYEAWSELGLTLPKFIKLEERAIYFEYFPEAKSLEDLIIDPNMKKTIFDKFLLIFEFLRKEAKKKQDHNIFHSDPKLANFIYCSKRDVVCPIDSGYRFNQKLSFEQIDTYLLAELLNQIATLNIHLSRKKKYLRMTKKILDEKDIENVLSLNYMPPRIVFFFLNLRKGSISLNSDFFLKKNSNFLNGGLIKNILLE